jgi:flagellar biosynthetic protein FliR
LNGNLIVIEILVKSFYAIPVNLMVDQFYGDTIAKFSSIIFTGSVAVAITVIAAIMMTNIAMAFISKFSPQFNLFSIGLNVSILIGLLCLFLSFQIYIEHGYTLIDTVITFYRHYLIGLTHHG